MQADTHVYFVDVPRGSAPMPLVMSCQNQPLLTIVCIGTVSRGRAASRGLRPRAEGSLQEYWGGAILLCCSHSPSNHTCHDPAVETQPYALHELYTLTLLHVSSQASHSTTLCMLCMLCMLKHGGQPRPSHYWPYSRIPASPCPHHSLKKPRHRQLPWQLLLQLLPSNRASQCMLSSKSF